MEQENEIVEQCPEFPYFGARYPDARCIDGSLYDLDKCDNEGNLYEMGEDNPCPFCRTEDFISENLDDEAGLTREVILEHIAKWKEKWGSK